jgi:hypothetical protein
MYGRKTGEVIPVLSLASFPRSGNKFAQQILHHVFGIKCRSVYPVPSYPDEIAPTWDRIEQDVILKTHELWSGEAGIYVVRDPRDVYCSYASYQSHIEGRAVSVKELLEITSWSDHVLSWQQPGVHLIRYEDLLQDPITAMKLTLERLHITTPVVGSMLDWDKLRTRCSWYYQRGVAGRWKDELTDKEIELCQYQNHENMKMLGYV